MSARLLRTARRAPSSYGARSVGTPSPSGGPSVGTPSPSGGPSVGTPSPSGGPSVGTPSPSGGPSVGTPSPSGGRKRTILLSTLRSLDEHTTRYVVDAMCACSDVIVARQGSFDFTTKTFLGYPIASGELGAPERCEPVCDVWIGWIDGYALDHRAMGFPHDLAFYEAMQGLFEESLAKGDIGAMYNSPSAERRTLKDYLTVLDPKEYNLIPSFRIQRFDDLVDVFRARGPVVVKPIWGGLRKGVFKVMSEQDLFARRGADLARCVAQDLQSGPEKRLWISSGRVAGGGVQHGKRTPWSDYTDDFHVTAHEDGPPEAVARERRAAELLAKKTGLSFGSIDFIGDRVNELNGGGTGFVMWNRKGETVLDARETLADGIRRLITGSPGGPESP